MPRKTTEAKPPKKEAEVTRDSKKIGVQVTDTSGYQRQFPLGCTWRWAYVLGTLMLEVLSDGKVICQTKASYVHTVTGPTATQPIWRTTEYPG